MSEGILWRGFALVVALQARVSGGRPAPATGVSIDTRTLAPGDLFFAIKGEASDGHDYVRAAFEKGASGAVIDEAHVDAVASAGPFPGPLYVVRDVLSALERLGAAGRARPAAWVAAVTGSVGKTSTKEALRLVLSRFGSTHASVASYNNHLGVPLTLARMPESSQFGVFEIGMNHAGEITPLVGMVRPQVAVVTTIAPVHLEHLGSIEAIADAKAEIFSGLDSSGVAIIPRDVAQFERLRDAAAKVTEQIFSFGEHAEADARLLRVRRDSCGSRVLASFEGEEIDYRVGAPGKHLAMNSLPVLLAARAFGCDLREAARGLAEFSPPQGRGQQARLPLENGSFLLIDEAYNANPASMRAALDVLGSSPVGEGGRRIAVLGDMLELGPDEAALHAELAEVAVVAGADLVFAAGPLMKNLFDALPANRRGLWAPTAADIQDALPQRIAAGDVVMVKGSNGSRMGSVVAALRTFSARFAADEVPSC